MSDTFIADNVPGETPTLYQQIRKNKRRAARLIRSVRDDTGTIQTSTTGIASAFTTFFQHKYRRIDPDKENVDALTNLIRTEIPQDMVQTYESSFTCEEIYQAINSGGTNRAPGLDGLSFEFYRKAWPLIGDDLCCIMNSMFFDSTITPNRR